MKRVVLGVWILVGLFLSSARADEPRAQFRLDGGQPHVGMPFTLQLVIEGFDEAPAPEVPKLDIPYATVAPLGAATPNVSRSIQIINGRRSESTRVTWALQWRIEVQKEGTLRVPATTVTQGAKKAIAQAGEVEVQTVPTADDMRINLELPGRPVFVGETVPITLTWLFRREPQDQTFSVPMLSSDAFTVTAPALQPQQGRARALTLSAGSKDLQLAYTVDKTTVGGVELNRLQTTFYAAPRKVGKVDIAPASIVAALPVGRADFFGNAPTRLFRASDTPRTLEVKPLPESDRPATFSGAVGDQFSISVHTSRSVVSLGEPMQLDVTIKSNQPFDILSLGRLDGEGRLPKDSFTVPSDPPTGELADEGKTKTFKITAQVTGPATEVPALAFSYFDPAKSQYVTIKSEPIALSVKGTNVVGAGDVVAIAPSKAKPAAPTTTGVDTTAIRDAQLALSSIGAVDTRPLGGMFLWILVGLLYALPLAMFGVRTWQLRTRETREDAAEVRAARRKVEQLLDEAAAKPAREVAGPLGAALRELAKITGRTLDEGGVLAKLETESFAPSAAANPLSPDLRSDAAGLLRRWVKPAALLLVLLGGIGLASPSLAGAAPLDEGRVAYQQAMELTTDATARKAAFARAQGSLAEAVHTMPDRPELLTDWGNAALGAGDVATATLAYRRALAIDGSNPRARANLAWLRARQGDSYRPASSGATDTLLFFHDWPAPRKLIVGAVAFAIAILLLVPWGPQRRRGMVGVSVLPFVVWIAMTASVVVADDHADDAVIMDDVVLRAADSAGAPATLPSPLPRGVEVSIRERRDSWTRVELANGSVGWVPSGAVERVLR